MKFISRNLLVRLFILESILSIVYVLWVYVANHGNPGISIQSFITFSSPENGKPKNVEINENKDPKDITTNHENEKRKMRYINIATTADDVFLPGVIGLIKTTYRNFITEHTNFDEVRISIG